MTTRAKLYLPIFFIILFLPFKILAVDKPILQINIPTVKLTDFTACGADNKMMCIPWIGEYIVGVYKYGIGVAGILSAIVLMWGGVIWLTAGGNQQRIGEAMGWIKGSVTGLVLLMTSYLILYQINPDLTIFKPISVRKIEQVAIEKEEDFLYEENQELSADLAGISSYPDFKNIKLYNRVKIDIESGKVDPRVIQLLNIIDASPYASDIVISCAIGEHRQTTVTGNPSRHSLGLAVDIVTTYPLGEKRKQVLASLYDYLHKYHASIGELFYSYRLDKAVYNGKSYQFVAGTKEREKLVEQHYNHIHMATFKK